jgi:stalled ribosome rescue protein Dom34
MSELLSKASSIDAALKNANALDKPIKKIRVFDFDDTLATSNNKVFATRGNERVEMNAEKFATDAAQMIEDGWTMDFSDFDNVTEGGRGPLFNVAKTIKEARGNEDLFVLTARGPNAETAIYDFLKAEGLEFKRENIVGLGKSPGEAKANWIIDKAAEGYNDFYFADDAYQNVKAVQDVLSVIDIKSKVQQAKIQESKQLSEDFNKLLEESTGIDFYKEYSPAKARTIGAGKGRFKFFIPYSAEDLTGLLYTYIDKRT